jgi:hypothetical protein
MDTTNQMELNALLSEADRAADPNTNGLLDRDELASIIRRLTLGMRILLCSDTNPLGWVEPHPQSLEAPMPA